MPTVNLARSRFESGYPVLDLFVDAGLAPTKSEARRLVQQGGAVVGDTVWTDEKAPVGTGALGPDGELILRAGKKRYARVLAQ
jgi:tyrosyl-tRNA synthetase